MKTDTIVCCVVALLLGMLLANMLKNVCGCKLTEGQADAVHLQLHSADPLADQCHKLAPTDCNKVENCKNEGGSRCVYLS